MTLEMIASTNDLTPAWLTALLRSTGDLDAGVSVATASVAPFGSDASMMSSLVRVEMTYDKATDAPGSLVVKLASENEGMRFIAGLLNFYAREVNFYTELLPQVSLDTPRCLHAEMYPDDQGFVLVLEELADCRQADQIDGLSFDDARTALEALAQLHAPFWGVDLTEISETMLPFDLGMLKDIIPGKVAGEWAIARPLVVDRVPAEVVDILDRAGDIWPTVMDDVMGDNTLVHADCRSDNLLFRPDGSVVILDFQLMAVANAMFDPAYLISQSLEDDAQSRAGELVDAYLAKVASLGIDVDLDQAMTAYRASVIFNLNIPVSLLGTEDMVDRAAELAYVMLDRASREILRTGAHLPYS